MLFRGNSWWSRGCLFWGLGAGILLSIYLWDLDYIHCCRNPTIMGGSHLFPNFRRYLINFPNFPNGMFFTALNSSFIAKIPFLLLRLELLVVYQEGLENAVAKDLHVRLDSMLLVCLCYYFSFLLAVYSFSCNSRPLIFWLLRPIGFLKCVLGITGVRDNFRCWSRAIQMCGFMQTFTFFGKFSQSPMVFISWFWVSLGWCLRLFLCKLIQNGCILC